ncbi:MAG: hypothetical protein ACP5RT_01410 [Candidatus Micrarchaeia archaeon]
MEQKKIYIFAAKSNYTSEHAEIYVQGWSIKLQWKAVLDKLEMYQVATMRQVATRYKGNNPTNIDLPNQIHQEPGSRAGKVNKFSLLFAFTPYKECWIPDLYC